MPSMPLVQLLSTGGDGTGTTNMAADGAAPNIEFSVDDAAGSDIYIARLIIRIRDSGSITGATFGAATALSNGYTMELREANDTVIYDLWPVAVAANRDLALYAYDVALDSGGNGLVTARWTFEKFLGAPLKLGSGQKLVVTCRDDVATAGVDSMEIVAEGYSTLSY